MNESKDRAKIRRKRTTLDRILVIGGAGYIGSVLTQKLINLGHQVIILDSLLYDNPPKLNSSLLQFQPGDFRQADTLIQVMDDIDSVIHLGAIVGDQACALNPRLTIETNLIGTRLVAQIAKASKVKRMVFASTCSVYGATEPPTLRKTFAGASETSPTNPLSLYAETKIEAEQTLLQMSDNEFTPIILRFATVYGDSPRPRFDLVVNQLAAKATIQQKITIAGGKQWRPFIHVTDAAEAIIKTLQAPKILVNGQIFNVGSNQENYQIEQLGHIIKQLLPHTQIIINNNIIDPRNYYINFDKIKKILGFITNKTVPDGIQEINQVLLNRKIINYQDPKYNNYQAITPHHSISWRQPSPNYSDEWCKIKW